MKNTERHFHSRLSLAESTTTQNSVDFPLNKLITAIWLRIQFTVTVGGTAINYVAATNAALQFIRNIQFKTSGDGMAVNAPGAALYHRAAQLMGIAPRIDNASYDPAAEAAYVMSVSIPLLFSDPLMARPEDTILDMSRYTSADLFVTLGAGTDGHIAGVGSGGTFAITDATCDIEIESLAGAPRDTVRPLFYQQIQVEGSPKNAASETSAQLTRSSDRLLKRVFSFAGNGGAISRPFSGTGSALIVDTLSLGDGRQYYDKDRRYAQILDNTQEAYKVAAVDGLIVLDYVRDGSNFSAIPTGDKAELKFEWVNSASLPASYLNSLSVVSDTLNKLK